MLKWVRPKSCAQKFFLCISYQTIRWAEDYYNSLLTELKGSVKGALRPLTRHGLQQWAAIMVPEITMMGKPV